MSDIADLTEAESAELAYGLLWHMQRVDRYTHDGRCASDARIAIGNAIGHERKLRGVKAAQEWMTKHPVRSGR